MKWKDEQYAVFSQQLSQLLGSGLNLVPSIQAMEEQRLLPSPVTDSILRCLKQGGSLADALEKVKFTQLFVSFMRVAEEHGRIEDGLNQCGRYFSTRAHWKKSIQRACLYPLFIFLFISATFLFMLQWVFPQFVALYDSLGVDLPLFTRWLFGLAPFIPWLGVVMLVGLILLYIVKNHPSLQIFFYRLPGISSLYRLRWTHFLSLQLGSLLHAGVPLLSSMQLLEEITPWRMVSNQISDAKKSLLEGIPFHQCIKKGDSTIVSSSFVHMVALGEQRGDLANTLLGIAKMTEIQIRHRMDQWIKSLEPIFLLCMGAMVAITVLSLFLPMLTLMDSM